ncbi:MAG: YicC family protein [Lachnospiraceae bacterium]|nr:YicC family protein [Lachnospiraceae bacterium]
MIKSMTGFGRCEIMENNRKFTVELKSVNHRYLDVNIKMPKKFGFFESNIRTVLKEYAQRGKVDVFITYEDYTEENFALKYNEDVAAAYLKHLKQMAETFGLENDIRVSTLSRYPEVFTMEEQSLDEKELWSILEKALRGACTQFVDSRIAEGERLAADLTEKLDGMLGYVDFIEERSPIILQEYRKRLEDKVKELLENTQIDEARIATEVTLFADKICVDEETVRLRSHIKSTRDALFEGGSIGRKLDFIAQEMNREANTILSKTTDLTLSDVGINLKTDIEKVREQIQNIE